MTDAAAIEFRDALVERQLDWIRFVEQFDERSARQVLATRLQADSADARAAVELPRPWPSQPENVARMMRRSSELVRFDSVSQLVSDGDRVLDIGCGHGVVAACVARRRRLGAYYGVDLNGGNVESARAMASANNLDHVLAFEQANATQLDPATLEALSPNVALFLEVLEHLDDPVAALRSVGDALGDQTLIVFSVPLLGRIEACWGHRVVFGADGIRGLADGAGLTLQHVREVHNTWALAVATRNPTPSVACNRFDPEPAAGRPPRPIQHVRLDRVAIAGGRHELVSAPLRMRLTTANDDPATVTFPTPDINLLRIDLGIDDAYDIDHLEIEAVDAKGDPSAAWTRRPSSPTGRRTTLVLRPGWPAPDFDQRQSDAGPPVETRLTLRARPGREASLTIWRIGFGSATTLDPVTILGDTELTSPHRSAARRAMMRFVEPQVDETRSDVARSAAAAAVRAVASRGRQLRGALRRR